MMIFISCPNLEKFHHHYLRDILMIVLEFCVDKSRLRYTTFQKPSTDLIPSEVIYHKMAIKVDAANKMILLHCKYIAQEGDFVPGRPGTEGFVPGHLLLPLSRDKGTPGQENFFVPSRGNATFNAFLVLKKCWQSMDV